MKKIIAILLVVLALSTVSACKSKAKRCLCISKRADVKTECRSYEKLVETDCVTQGKKETTTAPDDSTVVIEKKCVDAD